MKHDNSKCWVVLETFDDGIEGLCAIGITGNSQVAPLVTTSSKNVPTFQKIAAELLKTGRKVRFVEYTFSKEINIE
jgi:hypothetical protein